MNKLRNCVFAAGEDAQFTCVIQSAPSPKIRYTHTHTPVMLPSHLIPYCVHPNPVWCLRTCDSRWFKDSRLLTDQEKFQTFSELRSGVLVLVIKNLTERDLGHYDCEVG